MTFHGVDVAGKLAQHCGLISGAGPNFQHLRRGLKLQKLHHESNDVGLRNRLTGVDGKGMIFVGLIAIGRIHELMPRYSRHRLQQARIADSPSAELGFHHVPALDAETIGMRFDDQANSEYSGGKNRGAAGVVWVVVGVVAGDSPAVSRPGLRQGLALKGPGSGFALVLASGMRGRVARGHTSITTPAPNRHQYTSATTHNYFFRCRTRTSKLTTPFWSRTATMDIPP